MSEPAEKLNLSPQERRLVAGVGLVVFVILNVWLVWPHFGDWGKVQREHEKAERTRERYQAEIARAPLYQTRLDDLGRQGSSVVAEEQDLNLAQTVQTYSLANRLDVRNRRAASASGTTTNQFFEEQAMTIDIRSGTEELVNFLESLTSTNSLIRVRDLTLRPDPPNAPAALNGSITLVASYQRKVPAQTAAASATPAATVAKPAPVTATPTNAAAVKPAASVPAATNRPPTTSGTNTPIPSRTRKVPTTPAKS